MLASAVAKECGLNFISVKGPEILNKYIGASEKSVSAGLSPLGCRLSFSAPSSRLEICSRGPVPLSLASCFLTNLIPSHQNGPYGLGGSRGVLIRIYIFRGHDSTGVTDRVVNQMLTQMDGAEGLEGVYVLAATR